MTCPGDVGRRHDRTFSVTMVYAIVLVWKKDGTLRFCINFRCLNAWTKKNSYPILREPETMESLVGARYFSTMDLKSRFWQVKMSEESRQYTAFTVGSMGVYEFLRMLYGSAMPQQCFSASCKIAWGN